MGGVVQENEFHIDSGTAIFSPNLKGSFVLHHRLSALLSAQ
jgi:hypothetical protein